MTAPDWQAFDLQVFAGALDDSGLMAEATISVSLNGGTDDLIEGGRGNDVILAQEGDDVIYGGGKPTGNPSTTTETYADDDLVYAGDGNDQVWAGRGNDVVFGEADNDWISGGRGDDYLQGDSGDDVINGNSGNDYLLGGRGNDALTGGSGNDYLSDGVGNDTVTAGSGDDMVVVGEGDDSYAGGSGFDTLDFSAAQQGVTVSLSAGTASGLGTDTFSSFESAIGSSFDDVLTGKKGDEVLSGGAGNDVIRGMAGSDVLSGGDGNDTFQFMRSDVVKSGVSVGVDTIVDFAPGDVLDIADLLQGQAYGSIEDVVTVQDNGSSSTILAKVGGSFVEVAVLENFSGHTAGDMLKDGMLLV